MPISLYMDHHVPGAITAGLRLRHVDVLTAYEDGAAQMADPALPDRATSLRRVLFTQDDDLLGEATRRQATQRPFGGVIYAHQRGLTIGMCVNDLELIAVAAHSSDLLNQILYLPL